MYHYELGFADYSGSGKTQLCHENTFSKSDFEKMILRCVLKASKSHYEILSGLGSPNSCFSSLRMAMDARLRGDEDEYHDLMYYAYFSRQINFSYDSLHSEVVKLMCSDYGFTLLENVHSVIFDSGSSLCCPDLAPWFDKKSINYRAYRYVRRFVFKGDKLFSRANAEAKWSAIRQEALHENPVACENEDEALCKELGVEFIPYNHQDAVKARYEELKKINLDDFS